MPNYVIASTLEIRFGGGLAPKKKVELRTMSRVLGNIQNICDRGYLINKKGYVPKNSKLSSSDYSEYSITLSAVESGSLKLIFSGKDSIAKKTLEVTKKAVLSIMDSITASGVRHVESLADQVDGFTGTTDGAPTFKSRISRLKKKAEDGYAYRSIEREINNIATVIEKSPPDDAEIVIKIDGQDVISINKETASLIKSKYHRRKIGDLMLFKGFVSQMDAKVKSARFLNADTGRESIIKFLSDSHLEPVVPYFNKRDKPLKFYGFPIYEGDIFDPICGDVLFYRIVND